MCFGHRLERNFCMELYSECKILFVIDSIQLETVCVFCFRVVCFQIFILELILQPKLGLVYALPGIY